MPFYVNFDEKCKALRTLPQESEALVINVNPYVKPFVLEGIDDPYYDMMFMRERIEPWISLSYTEAYVKWNIRSFYSAFWFTTAILVYYPGANGLPVNYQTEEVPWLLTYTIEASRQIREKNSSVFVLLADAVPGDDG